MLLRDLKVSLEPLSSQAARQEFDWVHAARLTRRCLAVQNSSPPPTNFLGRTDAILLARHDGPVFRNRSGQLTRPP